MKLILIYNEIIIQYKNHFINYGFSQFRIHLFCCPVLSSNIMQNLFLYLIYAYWTCYWNCSKVTESVQNTKNIFVAGRCSESVRHLMKEIPRIHDSTLLTGFLFVDIQHFCLYFNYKHNVLETIVFFSVVVLWQNSWYHVVEWPILKIKDIIVSTDYCLLWQSLRTDFSKY